MPDKPSVKAAAQRPRKKEQNTPWQLAKELRQLAKELRELRFIATADYRVFDPRDKTMKVSTNPALILYGFASLLQRVEAFEKKIAEK